MPGKTSFYYGIFKKLQAATGNIYAFGQEHFNPDENDPELAGGFSLNAADSPFGVFGALSAAAPTYPQYNLQQGWQPLNPNSNDPLLNPLYVLLQASLGPTPLPNTVNVNGQDWPVMPQPDFNQSIGSYANWKEFNQNNPSIMQALGDWITAGKLDDTPKAANLKHTTLVANPPQPFGFQKGSDFFPILFIASFFGDDGRRPGDAGVPAVPGNHVPAHYWNTSRIFLTDEMGQTVFPQHLQPGEEYYVAVVIGNSGNQAAGRIVGMGGKIVVVAEAQAFNSGWGPAVPPLPPLSNLDPTNIYPVYEQYHLGTTSYDVIGFRLNIDSVIAGLKKAISDQGINLGGATVDEWLNDSHPCIKVLINSGEPASKYGPDPNNLPNFNSDPQTERHVAQRNLAPFLIPANAGDKKMGWKNFMVAQMGDGPNQLAIEHTLSPNTFTTYLAMPTATWERYVAKGKSEGFEVVREGVAKPFPDAVILRQTKGGARLAVANHAKEAFLGFALGIGWEPRRIRPAARYSALSLVHYRQDGSIGGGFTLQPLVTKETRR